MDLFNLTNPEDDYKCASGQKKFYIDTNGGKAEIRAQYGSLKRPKENETAIIIDSPKFLWASGRGVLITLIPIAPAGLYPKDNRLQFKAGVEDQDVKLEWIEERPEPKPVASAFGEMEKGPSPTEQVAIDVKAILEKQDLLLMAIADFVNGQ